jgi:hypothetical protein
MKGYPAWVVTLLRNKTNEACSASCFAVKSCLLLTLFCILVLIATGCTTPNVNVVYSPPAGAVTALYPPEPVQVAYVDLNISSSSNPIPYNLPVALTATATFPNCVVTKLEIDGTYTYIFCGATDPLNPVARNVITPIVANGTSGQSSLTVSGNIQPPNCVIGAYQSDTAISALWYLTVTATATVSTNGGPEFKTTTKTMTLQAGNPVQPL